MTTTRNDGEIWWVCYSKTRAGGIIASLVPGDVHGPNLGFTYVRDYLVKATMINRYYQNDLIDNVVRDYPYHEVIDERDPKPPSFTGAASAA